MPATTSDAVWRRLRRGLTPRASRAQAVTGLLCLLLGFGVATQVRSTQEADFSTLRQDELVQVLDQLANRADQLTAENAALEEEKAQLTDKRTQEEAAQQAAAQRAEVQGILAGTLAATGPGVLVTIEDPSGQVPAATLYLLVDELRNAGAEAISVGSVRVTAATWFADGDGGVVVDGVLLTPPYHWAAIGDSQTLQGALGIPGGALAAVRTAGGDSQVTVSGSITISVVKTVAEPQYATAIE
ncbi:MAG: DUF881 domain-containing protein [Bifidobacteriaceae bacterium]|jgi:uncharacterized protein YlxW (UPF0749 family)|nr:DUF881 domain-containing protein [Bifidobacteriaceae bacterium]